MFKILQKTSMRLMTKSHKYTFCQSQKSFKQVEQLSESTIINLTSKNFITMQKIQESTFDIIFNGQNILAQSKTGSGKTLAFALPILEKLRQKKKKNIGIQVVVIAPTRELAKQIDSQFKLLLNYDNEFKIECVYGGISRKVQLEILQRENPDILIGTPGRMQDFLQNQEVSFQNVQILTLDEVDTMLDMNFDKELDEITQNIQKHQEDFQVILFSATVPQWIKQTMQQKFKQQFEIVNMLDKEDQILPKTIKNVVINVDNEKEKINSIMNIIIEILYKQPESKILIFVNTIDKIKEIQSIRYLHGIAPVFYSNLSQERREILLNLFRDGALRCIVSTDVASRGLDIVNVDYVIHYDIPNNSRIFIHRSGRCGRNNQKGTNITMLTKRDQQNLEKIQHDTKIEFQQFQELDFEIPEISMKKFYEKCDIEQSFVESSELVQDLKQQLIEKYGEQELIDRLLLKTFDLDYNFKNRFFSDDSKFFFINVEERTVGEYIDIQKELQIPDKYVIVNKNQKTVVVIDEDQVEDFQEKYLQPGFVISEVNKNLAYKQYLKKDFENKAVMNQDFVDNVLIFQSKELISNNFDVEKFIEYQFKKNYKTIISNYQLQSNRIIVNFYYPKDLMKYLLLTSSDKIRFDSQVFQVKHILKKSNLGQKNFQNKFRNENSLNLIQFYQNIYNVKLIIISKIFKRIQYQQ